MKKWKLLAVCCACALLTSCSLLPEEEEFRSAPLIKSYEREEFKTAQAVRGDMALTQKITCTYVPVQTEEIRCAAGGIYYEEVLVKVGDSVEKGQLLAQLDMAGVEERLESLGMTLKKLDIRISALEENRALALERQRILTAKSPEAERKAALESVNSQYDRQLRALQDERSIALLEKAEYEKKAAERQLRAGIDGTVTYVRTVSPGDRSSEGDHVVTIADASASLFRTETKQWAHMRTGQEYTITVDKTEYEAIVVSEEELGLPEVQKIEGKAAYVYLKLKNPTLALEEGDRGTLIVTLDARENVLMVPEKAVTRVNGQTVVYYRDDEGMKAYKPVETGLTADGMTEIVSGLDEGEHVIAE